MNLQKIQILLTSLLITSFQERNQLEEAGKKRVQIHVQSCMNFPNIGFIAYIISREVILEHLMYVSFIIERYQMVEGEPLLREYYCNVCLKRFVRVYWALPDPSRLPKLWYLEKRPENIGVRGREKSGKPFNHWYNESLGNCRRRSLKRRTESQPVSP